MKLSKAPSLILFACGMAATPAASSNKLRQFGLGRKTKSSAVRLPDKKKEILSLRGGVKEENGLLAFKILTGMHGFLNFAAPEVAPKVLFADRFKINENALSGFFTEYLGSTFIDSCLMAHLATSSRLSVPEVVAYGTVPCSYGALRRLIRGDFKRMGFKDGFGYINALFPWAFVIAILSGKFDSALLAKVHVVIALLLGAALNLVPELGLKGMGLDSYSAMDSVTRAMVYWFSVSMIIFGIMGYFLLDGVEATKAIGYSAAYFSFAIVDANLIRKQNAPLNLQASPAVVFFAVTAAITYGLLG